MRNGLEGKINQGDRNRYKSAGERKIAGFLGCNNIRYLYEAPVLINSYDSKARIWYPDFYLPEFKTYIEYYGLAGDPDYERGIKKLERIYYAGTGKEHPSAIPQSNGHTLLVQKQTFIK